MRIGTKPGPRWRRGLLLLAIFSCAALAAVACDDDGSKPDEDLVDLVDGADGDTSVTPDTEQDTAEDTADTTADTTDTADTDTVDPCAEVTAPCDAAGTACNGETLVTCAPDANGCLVETTTECADGAGGFCDDSGAAAMCASDPCFGLTQCAAEGTTCEGETLVVCMANVDGCLIEMRTDCAAMAGGACDETAAPPVCTVDPCAGVSNCAMPGTSCNGDTLETCAPDANGCLVLATEDCTTTAGGYCDAAAPAACAVAELVCDDTLDDDADGAIDCADTDCANDPACQSSCGNGTVDTGEQCDDGNATAGDGCSDTCQIEGESCDAPLVVTTFPHTHTGTDWSTVLNDLVLDAASCIERTGAQGELVFQVDMLAGETLTVTETDTIDVVISILTGGTCDGTTACETSIDFGETTGTSYVAAADETVFVVVEAWSDTTTSPYSITLAKLAPEICDNGVDDNGNADVDCADLACAQNPVCIESICDDMVDNDGDADVDCADSDCGLDPACAFSCAGTDLASATGDAVTTGTTSGSTSNGSAACGGSGPEVIFSWTAPSTGCFTFDTESSSYDTVLEIRTACTGSSLVCDNDSGQGTTSVLRHQATSGETYIVWLDGYAGAVGNYVLDITPSGASCTELACTDTVDDDGDGLTDCLDPDCFADATCAAATCPNGTIGSVTGTPAFVGDNTGAGDDFAGTCALDVGGEDLVLSWTAPQDGCFQFDTENSSGLLDSVLYIYDDCTALTELACDEDGGSSPIYSSLLELDVVAGQDYFIVVDGYDSTEAGSFDLNIERLGAACTELSCTDGLDDDGDGLVDCNDPECFGAAGACDAAELNCADAADNDGDGLTDCGDSDCAAAPNCACGDGTRATGEQCDDSNLVPGDGCSATCQIENSSCAAPIMVSGPTYRLVGGPWTAVGNDLVLEATTCEERPGTQGELVFQVDLVAGQAVRLSEHGSLDAVLSIVPGPTCDGMATCAVSSDFSETTGQTYVAQADGPVFLVVEAYSEGTTSNFDIRIDVITPVCGNGTREPGEQCDDTNVNPGDGCSATCQIENSSCAAPIMVSGPTYQLVGGSWAAVGNDLVLEATTCVERPGAQGELVFQVDLVAGQAVRLSEHGLLDAVLSIVPGPTCDGMATCAASSDFSETTGQTYVAQADGPVFLVVEAYSENVTSSFDIRIDVITPICGNGTVESGEQCDDANVNPGDGCSATCQIESTSCGTPIVLSGPTQYRLSGADWSAVTNDLVLDAATCTERTGTQGEMIFQVNLLAGQTVRARELGSLDSVISILPGGTCGPTVTCSQSSDGAEATGLSRTAAVDETVFVVVEAWYENETDPWDIRITISDPEICGDGADNDLDGLVDCDDSNCFGATGGCVFELNCADSSDNDGDGQTNCADSDCAGNHACVAKAGFHEDFLSSETFDLVGQTLSFTPDLAGGYTTSTVPTASFLTTPGSGTRTRALLLGDSDAVPYALSLIPGGLPFFNASYTSVYVGSNGFVTFGRGDTSSDSSLSSLYEYPRIAGVDDDLDPASGANGTIRVDEFSDRLVVTYVDVPIYGSTNRNTFQITMHATGVIEITWLAVQGSAQRYVGISSGGTGTAYPAESNFLP